MARRDYGGEIQQILRAAQQRANECIAADDLQEAKRVLAEASRQVKNVKNDIKDEERTVRESYQDARHRNAASGQTVGMFMSGKARGSMARGRAAQGRKITAQKTQATRAFADVYADVDRVLRSLDEDKAKITDDIARRKAGSTSGKPKSSSTQPADAAQATSETPPAPTAAPPPTWALDPLHRHELRYWNGASWTEHVADQGAQTVDPI